MKIIYSTQTSLFFRFLFYYLNFLYETISYFNLFTVPSKLIFTYLPKFLFILSVIKKIGLYVQANFIFFIIFLVNSHFNLLKLFIIYLNYSNSLYHFLLIKFNNFIFIRDLLKYYFFILNLHSEPTLWEFVYDLIEKLKVFLYLDFILINLNYFINLLKNFHLLC